MPQPYPTPTPNAPYPYLPLSMAGVDALLSYKLEQYRAALEDAVRAAPRHAATPRPRYPLPDHPAALRPRCLTRYLTATLLLTHPPPSLSIHLSIYSIYLHAGLRRRVPPVVRMGAADRRARRRRQHRAMPDAARSRRRGPRLARPTLHHSAPPAQPRCPAPPACQACTRPAPHRQSPGRGLKIRSTPPPNGRDGRCRCRAAADACGGRLPATCVLTGPVSSRSIGRP